MHIPTFAYIYTYTYVCLHLHLYAFVRTMLVRMLLMLAIMPDGRASACFTLLVSALMRRVSCIASALATPYLFHPTCFSTCFLTEHRVSWTASTMHTIVHICAELRKHRHHALVTSPSCFGNIANVDIAYVQARARRLHLVWREILRCLADAGYAIGVIP